MLPEMMRPRQSLFDALNVPTGGGVTIKNEYEGFGGYVSIYIDGDIVGTLQNHETRDVSTGKFSLIGDIEDYMPQYKAYDAEGVLVAVGELNGTPLETEIPIAEIVIYSWQYSDTSTETAFDVGYIPKGGIFTTLKALTGAEYFSEVMDQDYLMDHSGTKAISNAVLMHLIKYGEEVEGAPVKVLSKQSVIDLCHQILSRFGDAWAKIYATLQAEYNPLENYNMKEEVKPDTYDQEDIPAGWNKQTKREVNQNVSVSDSGSHNQTDVWGFNSSTGVPSAKVTTDGTVTTSGDADDNYETVTETEVTGRKKLHKGSVQTERSGNIGVTTSQQMAQAEIDLRIKNHMEDIIFRDVDQVLTTEGYAPILSPSINLI